MRYKKTLLIFLLLGMFVTITSLEISASNPCRLDVSLLNQDTDPVLPGEYVDLVFQISGVDNFECDGAMVEILPEYPFRLKEGEDEIKKLSGPTYIRDKKQVWNFDYTLRVDEDALEGDNEITLKYSQGDSLSNSYISKDFNVSVEDLRADFEVSVDEYSYSEKEITFEILNTGKNDVEALTMEIPDQKDIELKESPRKIIGPLDKNDETTFSYKADILPDEEGKGKIDMDIKYIDQIQERRKTNATTEYNTKYFSKEKNEGLSGISAWFYLFIVLLLWIVGRGFWKKHKRKKGSEEEEDSE